MSLLIVYPVPKVPESAQTYSFRLKLPLRRDCPLLDPIFILNEGDSWNCNLCGADKPFFVPFFTGDFIPFQTSFPDNFNTDPSIINAGFKDSANNSPGDYYVIVELQDESGATVSDLIDTFSDEYYVAYSDEFGSVQTWFLNTAILPMSLKCWRLKVTYYKYNQITMMPEIERVIFTEYFRLVENCDDYVTITSSYSKVDCYGNIYATFDNFFGTSNPSYYSFARLEGEVLYLGSSQDVQTETDRGQILRRDIIRNYQLKGGIVAPFYGEIIDKTVNGDTVIIGNEEYENFSFGKNNEESREWVIDMTMNRTCELDSRNCSL